MKPLSLLAALAFHTLAAVSPATTVDASKFQNLQAALDAVSEAGGHVPLPPGLTALTQPQGVKTRDNRHAYPKNHLTRTQEQRG